MRKLILFLFISVWVCVLYAQKPFDLKTGDIVFQTCKSRSDFVKAIVSVTSSLEDLNFSHVGVAYEEDGKMYILEAIPFGVSKTPLEKFFKQSRLIEGNPLVVVGRLKPRYQKYIPSAIEKLKTFVGKPYDFIFSPDNDCYYCSEIIYLAYRDKKGNPIFDAQPMSFKDKNTGETSPLWVTHFKKHKAPIPEGVPGTSPGEMSKSKAIKIVHKYF